ncbi:MAG: hypothetical protein EOP53_10190 [Sphingobacteriales bacterium]|nr:MAG: hypothetical protein EOP53_10190 [Sphingobacteriales bacterium]
MQTRKTTYLILAIVFIVLNIFTTLAEFRELSSHVSSSGYDIGYIIGSQLFLYVGVLFLWLWYRLKKRMSTSQQQSLENSIDSIGSNGNVH